MVYAKNKSGDPDYDDKQPIAQHGGPIVKGPGGRDVLITEHLGPVDPATGEHVNMDEAPDARDNRPVPGEVATETSEVQTYTAEDTPAAARDQGDKSEDATGEPASVTAPRRTRSAKPAQQ